MRHAVERFVKEPEVPRQRRGGIDIERRSYGGGDIRHGNVLGIKRAVTIEKMVHASNLDAALRLFSRLARSME
ncbi:hypothetical protein GCM10022404_10510 [Celeribacter arenosi]|uniref:Uncharacterized protein n=1 Tax=Celeribacter arenosi TaxID=792649 RepID=A0ABP7K1W3_9RHOB